MAQVSRCVIFLRAFVVTLLMGVPTTPGRAQSTDNADWARSVQQGTPEGYFQYLRRNPTGQHIQEAIAALRGLGALGGGGQSVRGMTGSNSGRDGSTDTTSGGTSGRSGSPGGGSDPY